MVEETDLSLCAYLAGLRRELGRMLDFCRSCMDAWDTTGAPDSNTRSAPFVLVQGRCHRCWHQKVIERQIAEIERVQPAARMERRRARKAEGGEETCPGESKSKGGALSAGVRYAAGIRWRLLG